MGKKNRQNQSSFKNSKGTTQKKFSNQKAAGKSTQSCPLKHNKKCDLSEITFERVAAGLANTYVKSGNGKWIP